MAKQVLQCETCGAVLIYAEDGMSAVCSACDNKYFFQQEKSQALILALNRANRYRLNNNFDDAITEYRLVTDQNPTDAEAHWGLLISTYGIEYVEDPRTHRHIPTCRRTIRQDIREHADYLAALRYASPEQRARYEKSAAVIARLQKHIKQQLEDEQDYDVFISFKSTDDNDNPTRDRVVARRIYDELEKRGIRTFFSEVTLKDRIGEDYEPIIYKALYSCRYFVLVATDESYIESAWVKNEWSRFRDRIFDENLTDACCAVFSVPPKSLPSFLRKQGINLAKYPAGGYEIELADALALKLGVTKRTSEADELKRQIEEQKRAWETAQKRLEEELAAKISDVSKKQHGTGATVQSLLLRAQQEAADGIFDEAQKYYQKVLDIAPDNSAGWYGLFLCENRIVQGADMPYEESCASDTSGDSFDKALARNRQIFATFQGRNHKNACAYADEQQRAQYDAYLQASQTRYEECRAKLVADVTKNGDNCMRSGGQYDKALKLYDKALAEDPHYAPAWMGRYFAKHRKRDFESFLDTGAVTSMKTYIACISACQEAEKSLQSDEYRNALQYADATKREQWDKDGRRLVERCESLRRQATDELCRIAARYAGTRQYAEAVRYYDAYLEVRPHDVDALWGALFAKNEVADYDALYARMDRQRYVDDVACNSYWKILRQSAQGAALTEAEQRLQALRDKCIAENEAEKVALKKEPDSKTRLNKIRGYEKTIARNNRIRRLAPDEDAFFNHWLWILLPLPVMFVIGLVIGLILEFIVSIFKNGGSGAIATVVTHIALVIGAIPTLIGVISKAFYLWGRFAARESEGISGKIKSEKQETESYLSRVKLVEDFEKLIQNKQGSIEQE